MCVGLSAQPIEPARGGQARRKQEHTQPVPVVTRRDEQISKRKTRKKRTYKAKDEKRSWRGRRRDGREKLKWSYRVKGRRSPQLEPVSDALLYRSRGAAACVQDAKRCCLFFFFRTKLWFIKSLSLCVRFSLVSYSFPASSFDRRKKSRRRLKKWNEKPADIHNITLFRWSALCGGSRPEHRMKMSTTKKSRDIFFDIDKSAQAKKRDKKKFISVHFFISLLHGLFDRS